MQATTVPEAMISSALLDKKYAVTARFEGNYRPVLEITLESHRSPTPVDAIVVMMNPGSSEPKPGFGQAKGMVPTKPDPTQYQVMRLMERCQWSRVRVLNLSDLQNRSSAKFLEEINRLGDDISHSIFSPKRTKELQAALERAPGAPIILAWGCHSGLEPLATLARDALKGEKRIVGKEGARGGWRYWHPLLRNAKFQRQWLDEVSAQLSHGLRG